MNVTENDVGDLTLGADLLSSGGAAHTAMTRSWLEHTLRSNGPVELLPPDTLDPEGFCLAVGLVGSATLLSEKLPAEGQFELAVRAAERTLGRTVDAVIPLNAAGVNALIPIIAASDLSLPVIDVDGMGRIFPVVEQTVFTLAGIPVGPLTFAGVTGDVVTMEPAGFERIESLLRPVTVALGGWSIATLYPMTFGDAAAAGIHGAVSKALQVGATLRDAGRANGPRGTELADRLGGRLLTSGIVTEVYRPTRQGFPRGTVVVTDLDDQQRQIRLEVQNECMLALNDGRPLASVPDLICAIDRDACVPLGVEELGYGHVIDVVTLPAADAWHTEAGLAFAGPAAFGYPIVREARS